MHEHCRSVLMTTDAVGGVWTYSIQLARELAKNGTSTQLVVLGPAASAEQKREAAKIDDLSLFEYPCELEWMDEPWEGVARSGEYLLALARKYSPDIVHLNGYAHGALPFGCPKLVVGHSCVLSWWRAVKREPAPARYDQYRKMVSSGLEQADEVVAPSTAMLRELHKIYGTNAGVVIPNGIAELHTFAHEKENFVLCAGRVWDEAKNVATLAAAAVGLSVPVCVAGKGSERLAGVTPLGDLSAQGLRHWYERAAIYASPAYYEPFGLAILEAAASGAALVLSNIDSLRELWGDSAIYVSPDDELALRSALELLARDTLLRTTMAERARQRARTYTASYQAQGYSALYSRLLNQRTVAEVRKLDTPPLDSNRLSQGREPCGL